MSISAGGIALMSLRRPLAEWSDLVVGNGELRSILFAVVSFLVLLVLAHLTNPSEISFRTYLTEQSFRQHLSRLDDSPDSDHTDLEDVKVHYSLSSRTSVPSGGSRLCEDGSSFYFANRASVSLRTPKHILHSFGLFTIAAVVPIAKHRNSAASRRGDRDSSLITDSWFIGAFGKWWRGGAIEAWYYDIISKSKDEEGWSSGILGVKALDKRNEFNGLPFAATASPRFLRGSPPKLRNRERSSQRHVNLPARSSTPPPLPKSASLPLHATRVSTPDHRHVPLERTSSGLHPQSQSTHSSPEQVRITTPGVSRTPSGLSEQSPLIADVLRQISATQSAVHDLRTQLTEFQSAAAESHTALQLEANQYRERKRQEDASRLELKARTKTLEDSKRAAESNKREAEKKLRAAESARDDASRRIERLDQEISRIRQRIVDDEAVAQQSREELTKTEQELREALEHKKKEAKVAEDVVAVLNARAKDLEEKIANEKAKLKQAQEQAEIRKQDRSFFPLHTVTPDTSNWAPMPIGPSFGTEIVDQTDAASFESMTSESLEQGMSPPKALSLGGISNFSSNSSDTKHSSLRSKGYSIFDDDLASLAPPPQNHLFPFSEMDTPRTGSFFTPVGSSLIPSGLMRSLDTATDNVSRSFQSESDVYLNNDWRGIPHLQSTESTLSSSPISLTGPSFAEHDPTFEIRHLGQKPDTFLQRGSMPNRTHSDPTTHGSGFETSNDDDKPLAPRRWFSTLSRDKPKKGLNPDAKVFRLTRKKSFTPSTQPSPRKPTLEVPIITFDALNPNGLGTSMAPSTSTSLLRAFAPSPAEREALHRALGGSTNASLERLPSLSDVGSIPSSPSHVHAVAQQHPLRDIKSVLPSWLQALPRRKPNFSPWDDEPVVEGALNVGVVSRWS